MTPRCLVLILFVGLLISLGLSGGCAISPSSTPQPGATPVVTAAVPVISVQDASNLIQNNKANPDFIIIDVRTADEFNSGHLAKAVNMDYSSSDFKSNVDKLDRNKEYLIYCQTGIRGAAATQIMLDLGFTKVHNLSGGIVQWLNAGYPTLK